MSTQIMPDCKGHEGGSSDDALTNLRVRLQQNAMPIVASRHQITWIGLSLKRWLGILARLHV
jgi:hypothetical protein